MTAICTQLVGVLTLYDLVPSTQRSCLSHCLIGPSQKISEAVHELRSTGKGRRRKLVDGENICARFYISNELCPGGGISAWSSPF
uniref:Uncharacterized protein n=1 Tax=Arion vulgaris TaxID=1028688 RepID=A0A0B6XU72_9EUPU